MADKKEKTVKKTEDKKVEAKVEKPTKTTTKKSKTSTKSTKTSKKVDTKKSTKTTKKETRVDKKENNKTVKSTEKTTKHSTKKKVKDSSLWKISSVVLVLVVLFLALVLGFNFFKNDSEDLDFQKELDEKANKLNNGETDKENENSTYSLLVIEDTDCEKCNVDYFGQQIKENLIPELIIEKANYDSDVGKIVLESLGMKTTPVFLFSKSIDKRDNWEKLQQVLIPVTIAQNEFYLLNPIVLETKVLIENPQITDTAIVMGNPDAKVTIVEFSDFECPVCGLMKGTPKLTKEFQEQNPDFEPTIPKIFENYVETGKVKYVFYNFPIDRIHPSARGAHNAGLCANEQDKFKEYSDSLYQNRDQWVSNDNLTSVLIGFAKDLQLDTDKFSTCLNENKYNSQIDEELKLALPYGIGGTPTYFVNKQILPGLKDYEEFSSVIESELSKN